MVTGVGAPVDTGTYATDMYGTAATGGYGAMPMGGTAGYGAMPMDTGGYAGSYGAMPMTGGMAGGGMVGGGMGGMGGMGGGFFTASAGPDPMITQMTMMGAQYDGMIGQVTSQIPGMQTQLLDLQLQAATNPELAEALAPQIEGLQAGLDGANGLYEAQSSYLDSMAAMQQAQAATWESGMTNVKTASDGVANLASSIGDINTGSPPGGGGGGGGGMPGM